MANPNLSLPGWMPGSFCMSLKLLFLFQSIDSVVVLRSPLLHVVVMWFAMGKLLPLPLMVASRKVRLEGINLGVSRLWFLSSNILLILSVPPVPWKLWTNRTDLAKVVFWALFEIDVVDGCVVWQAEIVMGLSHRWWGLKSISDFVVMQSLWISNL